MSNAVICYVAGDSDTALEISTYLEAHTSWRCEMAMAPSGADFLDVIAQCLPAEFVIVVLSKQAAPSLWPRELWEPVLLGAAREADTKIAYVVKEACPFPQVLKRSRYFDWSRDAKAGRTALRQWMIQALQPERFPPPATGEEQPDESLLWLVESPGVVKDVPNGTADWMARHCWRDFEGIYRIDCAHHGRAGVMGELAHELGLRLPFTADRNWLELQRHAARYRALYCFEHLADDLLDLTQLGGKASILVVAAGSFQSASDDEKACLLQWRAAIAGSGEALAWPDLYSLASRAMRILKAMARLAEVYEALVWLSKRAEREGDFQALGSLRWEEAWILDEWDLPLPRYADLRLAQADQLWLSLPPSQ